MMNFTVPYENEQSHTVVTAVVFTRAPKPKGKIVKVRLYLKIKIILLWIILGLSRSEKRLAEGCLHYGTDKNRSTSKFNSVEESGMMYLYYFERAGQLFLTRGHLSEGNVELYTSIGTFQGAQRSTKAVAKGHQGIGLGRVYPWLNFL